MIGMVMSYVRDDRAEGRPEGASKGKERHDTTTKAGAILRWMKLGMALYHTEVSDTISILL